MNIRRLNILIALLGLVLPSLNAMGGRTYPSPVDESESRYRFRHLDDTNGLPYTWVWDIFQDSAGYMWFTTMY